MVQVTQSRNLTVTYTDKLGMPIPLESTHGLESVKKRGYVHGIKVMCMPWPVRCGTFVPHKVMYVGCIS